MPVRFCKQLISPNEFVAEMAYDRLEPWGPERMDYGFASLVAFYAQMHTAKGQPIPTPKDFMPDFLTDRAAAVKQPALTAEEEQAQLLAYAHRRGDTVLPAETTDEEVDALMLADAEASGEYWSDEE